LTVDGGVLSHIPGQTGGATAAAAAVAAATELIHCVTASMLLV